MRLLNFLPPSSKLHARSFIQWDSTRKEKRLVLSNLHSVSVRFDDRYLEGSADISYVIQRPDELSSVPLVVSDGVPLIGTQAPDMIRSLTEAYRPRASIAPSEVGNGLFDLRALAYVVGAAAACGASEARFPFSPQGVGLTTMSPTWTVPTSTEVTLGPGLATNDSEYQTLSSLCKTAGVSVIQIMGDTIPINTKLPIQGTKLASFCLRVFSYIISASNACGVADHHILAFFRGMCSTFSLWAHSDEGGWLRRALAHAEYPPSSGVLASTAVEVMGLPSRSNIPKRETTKYVIALFLEMAGIIPVADCYEDGTPFICARDPDSPAPKPSSFGGLGNRLYHVLTLWREIASVQYGLTKSLLLDAHSCRDFLRADRPDAHLESDCVIPFWWVEPSPLYSGDSGRLFMPGKLGERVDLKFSRGIDVMAPSMLKDYAGALPAGTPVRIIRSPGGVRDEAMSYVFSSKYRKKNGLSSMEYVVEPSLGIYTTDALFVEEGVCNAAERRWITPHNPVPNPAEGYTNVRTCVEYTYDTGAQPSLGQWSNTVARASLGFFRVNNSESSPGQRTHKTVPDHLTHLVDAYSRSVEWVKVTQFSHREELQPRARNPPKPQLEPAVPPEDTPIEGPAEETITSPPVTSPDVEPPDIPEKLDGDPPIRTVASNSAGGRVQLPNVQQEAEQPEGGDKPPTPVSSE